MSPQCNNGDDADARAEHCSADFRRGVLAHCQSGVLKRTDSATVISHAQWREIAA
jgi:hypothetical protein